MPATARKIEIEESDRSSGSAYADLAPGDYEAVLSDVTDYDKTDQGKGRGWVWDFLVEGLPFREYTSFSKASRWKLVQVVEAFQPDVLDVGINEIDPNTFIGARCGVYIDWEKDPDTLPEGEPNFKRIKEVFALPTEELNRVAATTEASASKTEKEVVSDNTESELEDPDVL